MQTARVYPTDKNQESIWLYDTRPPEYSGFPYNNTESDFELDKQYQRKPRIQDKIVLRLCNDVRTKDLEERFRQLIEKWEKDTQFTSSSTKLCMHPAYQQIIGMGFPIVPLLLRELQNNPNRWFWALFAITGEDPVNPDDAGDFEKMRESWIGWGRRQGCV